MWTAFSQLIRPYNTCSNTCSKQSPGALDEGIFFVPSTLGARPRPSPPNRRARLVARCRNGANDYRFLLLTPSLNFNGCSGTATGEVAIVSPPPRGDLSPVLASAGRLIIHLMHTSFVHACTNLLINGIKLGAPDASTMAKCRLDRDC
jgi:hypothetical protein